MDPFIAQIMMFGGNFAPRGWALCDGQLIAISSNSALFSLLGTTYGGDGQTTFALPDLRGRVPIHPGNGPGLSGRTLGQRAGTENTALTAGQMPAHVHPVADPRLRATANPANTSDPTAAALAIAPAYNDSSPPAADMADGSVVHPLGGSAGSGQTHNNMQPYLAINFIIALVGIFPSRN